MMDVLVVTGPIYLLMAAGYAAVRGGVFSAADLQALGRFVFYLALPALLFSALAGQGTEQALHLNYLAAYGLGSLATLAGGLAWARWRRSASWSMAGVQGLGMTCSNSGYIGFPILQQVLGPLAALCLAMNVLVENLIVIPLTLALADTQEGHTRREALVQALKNVLRNPLIWGMTAGLVVATLGWHLPAPVAKAVSLLGSATGPVALFVIGGNLVGLSLTGLKSDLVRVALGKLVVHPAAVGLATLGLAILGWPLEPPMQAAAVLMAAMPMLGVYPVLSQRFGLAHFSAAALLATTVLSFFTISAMLWWLKTHGGVI